MERLYKGNSLIRKLDDYTVLDIETTSLDTFSGEIVEISAIKVRDRKEIDRIFYDKTNRDNEWNGWKTREWIGRCSTRI